MTHVVRADHALKLIEVVYHGALASAERGKVIHEGGRLLCQFDYKRVLVDLRDAIIIPEPTHVMMGLAQDMAQAPVAHSSRLVYLVTPEQEANRIVENMATARHIAVTRFFDRDAAIAWLLDDAGTRDHGAA